MEERYAIERYEQAASLLPLRWRKTALQIADWQKVAAEELRLRTGQPITVLLPEGEQFVQQETPRMIVEQRDLEQLCDIVTEYSRYAACQTISAGYLSAKGGFRVGICGSAVMHEGRVSNLRDLSSAVIRISRERIGLAEEVITQLREEGSFPNTLIYSAPGLGKTTLLRDMIRCLSDGSQSMPSHRVALADERGEIAVMYQGVAQMSVGRYTDVLDGCPKSQAIPILLRAANPQILAVDEITQQEDLREIVHAANCGVSLLATIHAGTREELTRKPLFRQLLEMGVFSHAVAIRTVDRIREYEVHRL